MRLFFSLDNDDKFQEQEFKKVPFMNGDHIVTHDQDAQAYWQGYLLINNVSGVEVHVYEDQPLTITKQPQHLVFYTKIPKQRSFTKTNNRVDTTIIF